MLHVDNFQDVVLFDPAKAGADSLKIISGYASPTMASWHISEMAERKLPPIDITLIVGMCGLDGLPRSVHDGFVFITGHSGVGSKSKITCQYVVNGPPVHAKLYLWERSGIPVSAFLGSANYTYTAFSNARRELIHPCDPHQAKAYFDAMDAHSMRCDHSDIDEHIVLLREDPSPDVKGFDDVPGVHEPRSVRLPLLTINGDTGHGSNLNWGIRPDGTIRNKNQAYIRVPASIARSNFFPPRQRHFSVVTDDGKFLIFSVQQDHDKAISTPLINALVGEYFRNRLGVPSGAFVDRADLIRYGRTDVEFIKIGEDQFFMDFSVHQ